jgi:hypothetical protein
VLNAEAIHRLQRLAHDPAGLMLYHGGQLAHYSVGQLAREALAKVEQPVIHRKDAKNAKV